MKHRSTGSQWPLLLLLVTLTACGVDNRAQDSGGVAEQEQGFAVVNSDYQSVSISLVAVDGAILSETFIGSGSADAGLSAALSGDVSLPTTPAQGELVLIDRSAASVITWVNLRTGKVRAQLNVSTGFASNPHDYIPISPEKAYVTRFGTNFASGGEPFDAGNDVLVVDPSVPEITGRIDLMPALEGEAAGFYPSADRALLAGGQLRVLALGFNADFSDRLSSRVVSIDPASDRIEHVLTLDKMSSCTNLALSPEGDMLAIACNGAFGQSPDSGFPDSGIVLVNVDDEPSEVARFEAASLGGEMIASVAYANSDTLLFTTYGRYTEDLSALAAPDTLRLLDLDAGEVLGKPLRRSAKAPFSLGDVACAAAFETCVLADAESAGGTLHHFQFEADQVEAQRALSLGAELGLPPRYIGRF